MIKGRNRKNEDTENTKTKGTIITIIILKPTITKITIIITILREH